MNSNHQSSNWSNKQQQRNTSQLSHSVTWFNHVHLIYVLWQSLYKYVKKKKKQILECCAIVIFELPLISIFRCEIFKLWSFDRYVIIDPARSFRNSKHCIARVRLILGPWFFYNLLFHLYINQNWWLWISRNWTLFICDYFLIYYIIVGFSKNWNEIELNIRITD